jgi:aspartyl-tRNA(Asn)/glutamyl-tRNA(Gln) amidotransferase subunit A
MNELAGLTLREAADAVARRKTSAVELVEAQLERIAETEPLVHAYAHVMAETAIEEARGADADLARGRWRGPLHGVPIAFKDLVYTTQAPTEAGSKVFEGWVPGYDATVIRNVRRAGGIVLGKTHTHEFAYGVNIPPTRNPWRLDCYPGGSSAGSGAAVAARSAYGAIGTDGGGSIRCPASVDGVVGLKPTNGRVSRVGVVPMSATFDNVGPMTRTVEDCAVLLGAMAGHDPADPDSANVPVPDFTAELDHGVNGIRLGVERSFYFSPRCAPEVLRAVDAAIEYLVSQGAEVVDVSIPELELSVPIAMPPILADTTAYHHQWLRERADRYEQSTRIMIELGELIPATHYVTAQRARRVLRDRVRTVFDRSRLDALIAPTLPGPTVPVEELNLVLTDQSGESPGSSYFRQCVGANVIGVPALSVPAGFTSSELPIGMALFGRPFQEATIFRIARAYERAHEWHRRVPAFAPGPAAKAKTSA